MLQPQSVGRAAAILMPRVTGFLALAAGFFLGGTFFSEGTLQIFVLAAAAGLLAVGLITLFIVIRRRQVEADLFKAISTFVENDASPSFTTDEDGTIGYQNKAAVEQFGYKDGETLVAALSMHFASPNAVLSRLKNKAIAKGSAREDVVMRRGHLRLSVHKIGSTGFLWRLEDIAERGMIGADSETSSLPVAHVTKSGTVQSMNEAMRVLLGGRERQLDRIVNDLPIRSGHIHEIATAAGPRRTTVIEVEGQSGLREIYVLPEQSLTGSGEWQFFEALPVPMLRIGADGDVQMLNRLARELLGESVQPGTPLASLVEGLGRSVSDWLSDALEGRGINRTEVVRRTNASQDIYMQVTLSRVDSDGDPGLVAVLNDATELKTLEAQFVQSQKMQAIGQLAGGVAHDFNNLLTAISGHCDLLLLRHDEGDQDYGDLIQINQNANRAASLVGQLLAFSRKQNLQPRVLDMRDTLADLTHLLNRLVGEKVSLNLKHDPALKMVRADKRQLEQVLMNLVVNARDAMPDGGTIEIATAQETLIHELARDRAIVPAGEYVVVRVRDEGVGISPELLQKMFEPFYTTKKTGDGTGLGLSTAYGIVKQTGGFIFCDSIKGSGTTFSLYFPAHEREVVRKALPAETQEEPSASVREEGVVLLVEDEAPVRAFASRALRMRGYTVLEAENAEEALETLKDGTLDVDVFVTDVIMPGMDGPTWVKKALEDRPGTHVVFVSGYAEEHVADSQARIPNSVFLPKPFSLSELTAMVQRQLH